MAQEQPHRSSESMKNQPLVSVITPTYNRAEFIEETLDSILDQDYPNVEIIVIDDGSTDDTPSRLQAYSNRATILVRENRGENATVNQGFELSRGRYVCVVNSDDPLLPKCLSTLVTALEDNPDALLAYGDWVSIGPNHQFIRHQKLKEYTTQNMLNELNFGLGPGTLIRKSAIDRYGPRRTQYKFAGDMELFLRMSLHGQFIHVPLPLATHREHADSASLKFNRFAICREMGDAILRTIRNSAFPIELGKKSNKILAHFHMVGLEFYSETLAEKAHHRLRHLFHLSPVSRLFGALSHPLNSALNLAGRSLRDTFRAVVRKARMALQFVIYKSCDVLLAFAKRASNVAQATEVHRRPLFCFSTRFLPPMWSGQSVVIQRLLRDVPPDQYRLVGHPALPSRANQDDYIGGLPGQYFDLPPVRSRFPLHQTRFHSKPILGWVLRQIAPVLSTVNLVSCSTQRACQIVKVFSSTKDRPHILIGCTGDYYDPPATWLAARILDCQIGLYYFDDYREQWWADSAIMPAIRLIESYIGPRTDFFFAPNEAMQGKIIRNFDRPCHLVRNPMPGNHLPDAVLPFPYNGRSVRLVFTGAVYHLNYAVFRAIRQAVEDLTDIDATLHLYTAQSHEDLRRERLDGPKVVLHQHAKPEEIIEAQSQADILLIPFNIDPASNELVRTSATAKLADYLATGRPILAVVTEDSFLASFLERQRAGVVVCTNEPRDIADGVRRIVGSPKLRDEMRVNSRAFAKAELQPDRQRDIFLEVITRYVSQEQHGE